MSNGIKIKISQQIRAHKHRQGDQCVRIWTGTSLHNVGSLHHSEYGATMHGEHPETIITPIQFPRPGALPPAARAYPRTLPFKKRANDDCVKTGRRGRLNEMKLVLLASEGSMASTAPPVKVAAYVTADEMEEALLRRLSKQYHRHIFVNTNGRYGYIDDTLRFYPVDAG